VIHFVYIQRVHKTLVKTVVCRMYREMYYLDVSSRYSGHYFVRFQIQKKKDLSIARRAFIRVHVMFPKIGIIHNVTVQY